MHAEKFFDGTELVPGYCRTIRVGHRVLVGGTTSAGKDGRVIGESAYAQTVEIYRKIDAALASAGATRENVVRIVVYCTDIAQAGEIVKAHVECYGGIDPVMTLVAVSALIRPDMLVEIEAEAFIPSRD